MIGELFIIKWHAHKPGKDSLYRMKVKMTKIGWEGNSVVEGLLPAAGRRDAGMEERRFGVR